MAKRRPDSIQEEVKQIRVAEDLIRLGARAAVIEAYFHLSDEMRTRLFREVTGAPPVKGQSASSAAWFDSFWPCMHASLFAALHKKVAAEGLAGAAALAAAYRLYLSTMQVDGSTSVLDITRAWLLLRFLHAGVLTEARCKRCNGTFVVNRKKAHAKFVCCACAPPMKIGKTADFGGLGAFKVI